MARILYTNVYIKKARKFIRKHPELANQYKKTLTLLELNPTHRSLRLHKLGDKDLYSVSINLTYRLSLEFLIEKDTIIAVNIGTHDEVYR